MRQIERIITGVLGAGPPAEPAEALDPLYRDLIAGVDAVPVLEVAIGRAWVLVRTAANAGLAFSPRWPAGVVPALRERIEDVMLRDLARLVLRRHELAAAIGVAAINAHYNQPTLVGVDDDGLSDDPTVPGSGPTVVIGRFPGLDDKLPGVLVIERNPGPRDLPESAAERVLPTARRVLITASTLSNHSLPHLLALARGASISLIGPGTPLAPCLFRHAIAVLAGFVLDQPEGAAEAVARGDGAAKLRAFGRRLTLKRAR
jgi:uncharacterized protein (DUF4213/DUF364 family)